MAASDTFSIIEKIKSALSETIADLEYIAPRIKAIGDSIIEHVPYKAGCKLTTEDHNIYELRVMLDRLIPKLSDIVNKIDKGII